MINRLGGGAWKKGVVALLALGALGASTFGALADPVKLTIISFVPQKYYQALFDAFQAKYPDITLSLEPISLETSVSGIKDRFSKGDATYDIFLADQSWTADLAGAALDLNTTSYSAEAAKLPGSVIAGSTFEGKLVAAPYWGSYNILFYNKDLLEKAGIEFPSSDPTKPWTYEQLFEAGKKAQAAGAKWGLFWDQPDQYYERQAMIESAGGGSGLTGDGLLTPDVNNAGWKKAMAYYSSIFSEGLAPRGVPNGQGEALFNNGEVAFWIGQAPLAGVAETQVNYGIAPIPGFEGGSPVSPSGSGAWAINPNSPNIEAALKFVTFDSTDFEGAMAGSIPLGLPVLPEATAARLKTLVDLDPRLTGLEAIVAYTVEHNSVARPPSTKYSTFEAAVTQAILDIRNGADVNSTLDATQDKLVRLLSR